ncbi:MAG: glycosyltransferase family 4 protein [Gammaproteobacteria bacterium]|nr:glycosyltransferase family 4 protein [Gammaproteobacteria bacterium]
MKQSQSATRVLFLSPHYPPDVAATGQLIAELAEDLVSSGHEAIVIASRPSYTEGTSRPYRLLERELRDGVEIHWLGVPGAGRRGIWSRLLPFAGYFVAAIMRAMFIRRVDVVFAQSTPPLLAGLLAAMLAVMPNRRFVYNLQDVYPELGQALGVLGDGPITRLSRRVESGLRRRADVVTVLAQDMKERVLDSDPQLDNVSIIPNWADSARVTPVAPADNTFLSEHGLADRFVVMYSGNLGRAHGVEILPEVAEKLADLDDLILLIVGAGPAKESVSESVRARGLKNVVFLPYQHKERLKESLSTADVALILQRRSASGLVVPSKIYGIMASGRPAVAAVPQDSEVARVLQDEQAGLVVEPGSAQGIADAVRDLYGNRSDALAMGNKARLAAVDRYDRSLITGRYINLLTQLKTT